MRLHVFPHSNNAIAVLAITRHLELPVDVALVDLLKGEQKTPAFTALNPNQRMPVLEDGPFVLWESNAIAQYLAAQRPASGLWPTDPARQADVSRWQFWQTAHWGPICTVYTFERVVKRFADLGPADEAAIARAEPDFHTYAGVLDGQLRGRRWVTGDQLTVADFSLGAWLVYADPAGLPLGGHPEIVRWYAELCTLPAWQRALPPPSRYAAGSTTTGVPNRTAVPLARS
jgi:glutathione S-transferase